MDEFLEVMEKAQALQELIERCYDPIETSYKSPHFQSEEEKRIFRDQVERLRKTDTELQAVYLAANVKRRENATTNQSKKFGDLVQEKLAQSSVYGANESRPASRRHRRRVERRRRFDRGRRRWIRNDRRRDDLLAEGSHLQGRHREPRQESLLSTRLRPRYGPGDYQTREGEESLDPVSCGLLPEQEDVEHEGSDRLPRFLQVCA
ncbi:hypothetical protein L596_014857 [Steinernema carpocapsae]|uniref:Uncharacterized protein n=1 Tax=Steinernema carpocapsae TaxID=34508 RepID=A0A4U5ND37_STECR|nr:hypothetical protein L596_014857 [Steinernema carpocapsae]